MAARSRAERDAITVEIVYALVTAAALAAVTGLAAASPILLFDLDGAPRSVLAGAALALAAAVFVWRLVNLLWGYGRKL